MYSMVFGGPSRSTSLTTDTCASFSTRLIFFSQAYNKRKLEIVHICRHKKGAKFSKNSLIFDQPPYREIRQINNLKDLKLTAENKTKTVRKYLLGTLFFTFAILILYFCYKMNKLSETLCQIITFQKILSKSKLKWCFFSRKNAVHLILSLKR